MIILGNIVALIASCFMVYAGSLKKKSKILFFQCIELALYVVSNLILKGISGAIINFLCMISNILGYKNKLNIVSKIIISILAIILTIFMNNNGIFGYLPLVAMITYIWALDIKKVVTFKRIILVVMVLWVIYDYSIKSYTSIVFDILTIIANIVAIIQIKKGKKKRKK